MAAPARGQASLQLSQAAGFKFKVASVRVRAGLSARAAARESRRWRRAGPAGRPRNPGGLPATVARTLLSDQQWQAAAARPVL